MNGHDALNPTIAVLPEVWRSVKDCRALEEAALLGKVRDTPSPVGPTDLTQQPSPA
jgi:hypothetical protein